MTFLSITSTVCVLAASVYNVFASYRNHKRRRYLNEYAKELDEATEAMMRYADANRRTQEAELLFTADSEDADAEEPPVLKISLDEIDISRVKDRATRRFLLKRRLMMSFCPN